MPSAYYAPLDQPLTSTDDDDEEADIERHQQQHQRRPKGAAAPSIPFLEAHHHSPMAHLRVASGVVGGRRRCLLPLVLALLFLIAFCYFTFGADTRLALGLGGGGGGSDDSDDGMHSLGKQSQSRGLSRFRVIASQRKTMPMGDAQDLQIEMTRNRKDSRIRNPYRKYGILSRALNETLHLCSEGLFDQRLYVQDKPMEEYGNLPIIYFVTPTYPRREQIPELTRLAHTLLHVPRLHWLVANDQEGCNVFMDLMLKGFGIPYTHLASPMPSNFRKAKPAPRGVANRRAALQWLRQRNLTNGILYFGDDDNTYDLRLFSEIRQTQRVSMFPVGFIADYGVSGPVVRKGKVVAFLDSWLAGRRWPVDMAGFAVNLQYMAQFPNVNMPYKPGFEEDRFLRSIGLRLDQIEPRGNNCTEILVWHTQTKSKKAAVVRLESEYLDGRSNLGALFRSLKIMGVASASDTEGPKALISKNGKAAAHSTILS
ncbi:galactosylgalactosylxylosylprotein 3-beta-glucuronosyltransferase S isoform X1 [Drosophila subobscura]|uniref:galactosylgalactosylxylosylprotein 3-beta-glucuronosyltransferase S isoform X1 n=2 Tax=Drosophila subobscura TaxID=7241 RepID=UPI00155B300D|nr:galactosylgalactosylxylosylprotein 3-beta-glucuronosyltransferase S isoform X1 [Drosophila subobscura]